MIGNLLALVILLGLTVLGGWALARLWRERRAARRWSALRWLAGVPLALVTLLLAAATVLGASGYTSFTPRRTRRFPRWPSSATPHGSRAANTSPASPV